MSVSTDKNTCNICNKVFQSKTHLTRHKNRIKPCKVKNTSGLTDAIKQIFTDPNNYLSPETIALLRNLLDEKEKTFNANKESNLVNKQKYKCDNCQTEFAHKQSLFKHHKFNRCTKKLESNKTGNIITNI